MLATAPSPKRTLSIFPRIHESRFTNPWRAVAPGEGGTIHSCSLLDRDGGAAFHFLREADDVPIRESHTAMAD